MLSELEITEEMLQEAEAISNMCDQQAQSLGEGMCKGGQCDSPSNSQNPGQRMDQGQTRGMNGGRAQGGNTAKSKTPTATKIEKAKAKAAGGDIIARQLVENPNPEVGESVMPSESNGEAVDGGSGAAVQEERVPAHLKDAHKHYFGTLKREITKKSGAAAGSRSTTPSPS